MSSTQSAVESNAEDDRRAIIDSLKTWHTEFKTIETNRSTPSFLGRQLSSIISTKQASLPQVPLKPILKDLSIGVTTQKKFFFSVDEERIALRERINLFKHYGVYFISNDNVRKIKKIATMPGFFLYLDKNSKVCVLVVHQKSKNETIHLSLIEEIDPVLIESWHSDLVNMQTELAKSNISWLVKLPLKSNRRNLIIANCTAYLSQKPISHNRMHPMHIFLFSNSKKIKTFSETYFFEENIYESWVFNEDSTTEDVYIIFSDPLLSEAHQNEIEAAKKRNLHLMQVTLQEELDLDINRIIDSILEVYIIPGENPIVAQFKKEVSNKAKRIAKEMFSEKKWILSDFIKICIVANKEQDDPFKKRFLECVERYYQKKRELEVTKDDLKMAVKSIKRIYKDSCSTYEVQNIPVQGAVLSPMALDVKIEEDPKIVELKNWLDDRAKQALCAPEMSAFRKRVISKKLVQTYAEIDSSCKKKIDLRNLTEAEKDKILEKIVTATQKRFDRFLLPKTAPTLSQQSAHEIEIDRAGKSKKEKSPERITPFWAEPQTEELIEQSIFTSSHNKP